MEGVVVFIPVRNSFPAFISFTKWDRVRGRSFHLDKDGYPVYHRNKYTQPRRLHWIVGFKHHDHIDRNKLNCLDSNFRECTHLQNTYNFSKRSDNTSGYIGVYWNKQQKKYQARINADGKMIYIGSYDCILQAAIARDASARLLHKEFAVYNFKVT